MIIDYHVGNYQSVANALDYLKYEYRISDKGKDIVNATAYILPGVGTFGEGMKNLFNLKLIEPLCEEVLIKKKPILGICMGMQIFAKRSTENGIHNGLGWIDGCVDRFILKSDIRVPHVGWNTLKIMKRGPKYLRVKEHSSFYFDHSYYFMCDDEYVSAKCYYGIDFVASIQKGNIFGVQFHPEKSQNAGLRLFRGFFNYLENENNNSNKNVL